MTELWVERTGVRSYTGRSSRGAQVLVGNEDVEGVFTPGELIGNHAGWPKGSDPAIEQLAAKALFTTAPTARKSLYQQLQLQLNERGPFFPLMQPAQVFVATADLRNAVFDAVYQVDVTQVSST